MSSRKHGSLSVCLPRGPRTPLPTPGGAPPPPPPPPPRAAPPARRPALPPPPAPARPPPRGGSLSPGPRRPSPPPGAPRALPRNPSRKFGARRPFRRPPECRGGHCGVDLGSTRGDPVFAIYDGVVERIERDETHDPKSGRYVRIGHVKGKVVSRYIHLDSI